MGVFREQAKFGALHILPVTTYTYEGIHRALHTGISPLPHSVTVPSWCEGHYSIEYDLEPVALIDPSTESSVFATAALSRCNVYTLDTLPDSYRHLLAQSASGMPATDWEEAHYRQLMWVDEERNYSRAFEEVDGFVHSAGTRGTTVEEFQASLPVDISNFADVLFAEREEFITLGDDLRYYWDELPYDDECESFLPTDDSPQTAAPSPPCSPYKWAGVSSRFPLPPPALEAFDKYLSAGFRLPAVPLGPASLFRELLLSPDGIDTRRYTAGEGFSTDDDIACLINERLAAYDGERIRAWLPSTDVRLVSKLLAAMRRNVTEWNRAELSGHTTSSPSSNVGEWTYQVHSTRHTAAGKLHTTSAWSEVRSAIIALCDDDDDADSHYRAAGGGVESHGALHLPGHGVIRLAVESLVSEGTIKYVRGEEGAWMLSTPAYCERHPTP